MYDESQLLRPEQAVAKNSSTMIDPECLYFLVVYYVRPDYYRHTQDRSVRQGYLLFDKII
jgi:hypothetical protein